MARKEYDKRLMGWLIKTYGALARSLLMSTCFGETAPKYSPTTDTYHITVNVDNNRSSNKALRILQQREIIYSFNEVEVHNTFRYFNLWVCSAYRSKFKRLAPRLGSKPSDKRFIERNIKKANNFEDLYIPINILSYKELIYVWFHKDKYEFKVVEKKSTHNGSTYRSRCLIPKAATRRFDKAIFDEKFKSFFETEGLWVLNNLCGAEVSWNRLNIIDNISCKRLKNDIEILRANIAKDRKHLKDTIRAYKAVKSYGGLDKLAKDGYDQRLEALIQQAPLHAADTEKYRKLRELSKMTLLNKHKGDA